MRIGRGGRGGGFKKKRRSSGFRKKHGRQDKPFKIQKEDTMATRDGAKKWLRRAIASGRVIPPSECSACHRVVRPRPNAYQPNVTQPEHIIWLCPECQVTVTAVKKGAPAESYSVKDLVHKLMKEAETAEMIRWKKVEAGSMSKEEALEDEHVWEERMEAAQAAYRREMGMEDVESLMAEQETERKNPFDLLDTI